MTCGTHGLQYITSVFTLILIINIVTVSALCVTRSTYETEITTDIKSEKPLAFLPKIRKQGAKKQKILPQSFLCKTELTYGLNLRI